jgi:hypothetical protein
MRRNRLAREAIADEAGATEQIFGMQHPFTMISWFVDIDIGNARVAAVRAHDRGAL